MKKTLLLGMVLIARVAFAADLGAIDAWQDEAIEPPETVYVDPRLSPLGAQEHHHYHPTLEEAPPSERNAESLFLSVPLHARRGLTAQVSLRYRKVRGEAIVRLTLSPGLQLEYSSLPPVRGADGELLWFGLTGPMGNLKIKARIHPEVPIGTALLVHADLIDGFGKVEQQTETIVVR